MVFKFFKLRLSFGESRKRHKRSSLPISSSNAVSNSTPEPQVRPNEGREPHRVAPEADAGLTSHVWQNDRIEGMVLSINFIWTVLTF
jgi:hypothetical protein